jgi:K+-sensing histidine kinase KdpD
LAIAKHLIEAHGGHIWVESEVGEGSQFHVSVPVFDAERSALRSSVAIGASGARTSRPLPSV